MTLELALSDTALAKKRFLSQIQERAQFAADLKYFATEQQLYQQLLKTLHLTTSLQTLSLEDYRYTKGSILNSGFIRWVDEHRSTLQGIITIPQFSQLTKDPLRLLACY